jgi:C4-dicarboxylate transporter DctM subunit
MEIQDLIPFAVLFLLIALKVPIGFSLLLAGMLTSALAGETAFLSTVRILVDAPRHYTLIAIPLFILTAEIFVSSGLIRVMFDAGRAWIGHWPGGLGNATVAGTILFAGTSGSSAADAAAFSRVGVEGMTTQGFRREFAASVVASSATLAIMIPPSIAMIIYGSLTDTSIGALMFGGVVPGLTFGLVMMVYVAYVARREKIGGKLDSTRAERWYHFKRLLPILGLMVVILGGFYTGRFTATEVSTMSALFAFLMARFFYRKLSWRELPRVFARTASTTAAIFLVIIGGTVLGKALTASGFAARLVSTIGAAELTPTLFLIGVSAVLYFLGMFLEGISLNVMTTPLLAPIAIDLGIDPVQYGIFLIFNIEVALISPPVGLHLFIASAATGVPIGDLYRSIWPFIGILLIGVLTLIFIPDYALWLPRLIYAN